MCLVELATFALAALGAFSVLLALVWLAKFVLYHFISKEGSYTPAKYGGARKGAWAVITGSSDGIGKGFAQELAKDGFNLLLVSRTESKLKDLSNQLSAEFGIQSRYIATDVSSLTDLHSNVERIRKEASGMEVTILVNNVGMNTDIPVEFHEMQDKEISDLLNVNVLFTTYLTRAIIPQLLERKTKTAIINLSSVTAHFPSSPLLSVYAGSKAYISSWSKALTAELSHHNCDVLAVSPGFVVSAMSGYRKPSLLVATPTATARDTLGKLGVVSEISPYYAHALQRYVIGLIPESFSASKIRATMMDVRKKKLQKLSTPGSK
eukprot:TRINITY_DN608_c0_g1_i1.p1 TRINITY_DN608_c0_g1~~TRINITY_DN608_c0_g1_i1.p1  ORF type:complete len:322 (+),score=164.29 TRINITY_DN608_c0_g1_i1:121-1086(+)